MSNTRTIRLWLSNEEGPYRHWTAAGQEAVEEVLDEDNECTAKYARMKAADNLGEMIRESITDEMPAVSGLYADLLYSALAEVEWSDVASDFTDEVEIFEASNGTESYCFVDRDLAKEFLLDKIDPETDAEGSKRGSIEAGEAVVIEGETWTITPKE